MAHRLSLDERRRVHSEEEGDGADKCAWVQIFWATWDNKRYNLEDGDVEKEYNCVVELGAEGGGYNRADGAI